MDLMKNAQRAKRFLGRLPRSSARPKGLPRPRASAPFFPDVPPEQLTAIVWSSSRTMPSTTRLDHAMLAVRQRRVLWLEYIPFLYTIVRVAKPRSSSKPASSTASPAR